MTRQLFERVVILTEQLQSEAGLNPLQDREFAGYIKAVKDMVNVELDFEEAQ